MKRIFVFFVLFVTLQSTAIHGQKESTTKTDDTDNLAILTISNPLFEGMCKSFAKRLAIPKGEKVLFIEPKLEDDSEQEFGDIWIVTNITKSIEVHYADFPHVFVGLRGTNAKKVVGMICFLTNDEFYTSKQVSILANIWDLNTIAKSFR